MSTDRCGAAGFSGYGKRTYCNGIKYFREVDIPVWICFRVFRCALFLKTNNLRYVASALGLQALKMCVIREMYGVMAQWRKFEHRSIFAVFIGACLEGSRQRTFQPSLSFRRGKHHRNFRLLLVAVAALDQHKGYKGPPLTGTIRLNI